MTAVPVTLNEPRERLFDATDRPLVDNRAALLPSRRRLGGGGFRMTLSRHLVTAVIAAAMSTVASAQTRMPASPPGTSAVQVGGKYVTTEKGPVYQDGQWVTVTYGRPLLRGRTNIFGSGATYGKDILLGAPVWRVGANVSTRFKTDVPLVFAGKTLPVGEYSMFVDISEKAWTLIFSNWPQQTKYDPSNKEALWGAFNYTADRDVLRAPMTLSKTANSLDQLTIQFVDVTSAGGTLMVWWEKQMATVPFTVGK
jgi:hypothetical protein